MYEILKIEKKIEKSRNENFHFLICQKSDGKLLFLVSDLVGN